MDTTRGASYYYSIAMTQGSLIAIRDKLAIVGEQRGRALNSIDKRGGVAATNRSCLEFIPSKH